MNKGYVPLPHGQLHYRRWPGRRPLVLIHQSFSSSRMWERLAAALSPDIGVVGFDLPGHGESDPFPSQPTFEAYADVVADGCAQLGLDRVSAGGFHAGAGVAIELATRSTPTVESLALFGVPLYPPSERDRIRSALPHRWSTSADGSHLLDLWGASSNPDHSIRTRELVDKLTAGPDGWWFPSSLFTVNLQERLPLLAVPVLIIHSEKDFVAAVQPRAEALIPGARRVALVGEVLVTDDQTEEVAAHIRHFLAVKP